MRNAAAALSLAAVLLAVGSASTSASTAPAPPSRLEGKFTMKGTVTKSVNITGEKQGDRFTRTWTFKPSCAQGVCAKVGLKRTLKDGSTDSLQLLWNGSRYVGKKTSKADGYCSGKVVPKNDTIKVRITVDVTSTLVRKGVHVSTKANAHYDSHHTIDCGTNSGTARSVASYTGKRTDTPPKPQPTSPSS